MPVTGLAGRVVCDVCVRRLWKGEGGGGKGREERGEEKRGDVLRFRSRLPARRGEGEYGCAACFFCEKRIDDGGASG